MYKTINNLVQYYEADGWHEVSLKDNKYTATKNGWILVISLGAKVDNKTSELTIKAKENKPSLSRMPVMKNSIVEVTNSKYNKVLFKEV